MATSHSDADISFDGEEILFARDDHFQLVAVLSTFSRNDNCKFRLLADDKVTTEPDSDGPYRQISGRGARAIVAQGRSGRLRRREAAPAVLAGLPRDLPLALRSPDLCNGFRRTSTGSPGKSPGRTTANSRTGDREIGKPAGRGVRRRRTRSRRRPAGGCRRDRSSGRRARCAGRSGFGDGPAARSG